MHTSDGLRAVSKGKPIASDALERYLASKFGEALKSASTDRRSLASFSAKRTARASRGSRARSRSGSWIWRIVASSSP
jgi:hypothetical protein